MYKISELENNDFLNDDNCYGIIPVYDENLSEMARVGIIPDTSLEIHIEGGEGYIPHMHICKKSGKNIITRIELLNNKYFREKDDRNNILNRNERIALNNYMNQIYSEEFGLNRWQSICLQWNQYNPSHEIKNIKNIKQPDYTTIDEP